MMMMMTSITGCRTLTNAVTFSRQIVWSNAVTTNCSDNLANNYKYRPIAANYCLQCEIGATFCIIVALAYDYSTSFLHSNCYSILANMALITEHFQSKYS